MGNVVLLGSEAKKEKKESQVRLGDKGEKKGGGEESYQKIEWSDKTDAQNILDRDTETLTWTIVSILIKQLLLCYEESN